MATITDFIAKGSKNFWIYYGVLFISRTRVGQPSPGGPTLSSSAQILWQLVIMYGCLE